MAHLQNDIVSACTANAQAIYDANGQAKQDYLEVASTCDTGASTPSIEQLEASFSVKEEKDIEIPPIETLKSDINRSAHDLSAKIDQYRASGKQSVDDGLHVSYVLFVHFLCNFSDIRL